MDQNNNITLGCLILFYNKTILNFFVLIILVFIVISQLKIYILYILLKIKVPIMQNIRVY